MPIFIRRSFIHYQLFPKQLRWLFVSSLLRSVTDVGLGIFIPLFLYGFGKSVAVFPFLHLSTFVEGMILVCLYYALQRLIILLTAFPVARIMKKIGYVGSMAIGTLMRCVGLGALVLAPTNPRFLLLAAFGGAMDLLFYWVAHDSVFACEVKRDHLGRGVGALAFLTKLIQVAIPAIAGVIAAALGFGTLFVVCILFCVLSIIPLLLLPKIRITSSPSIKELVSWLKTRVFARYALVNLGQYMDTIAILLWPVYVKLIVGKIERVGFLFSLVLFVSLVLTYVAGWYVDHKKNGKLFFASGSVVSALWIARIFVRGVWDIIAIELCDKLASSFYNPCLDAQVFARAKGIHVFSFHVYREILYAVSALVLWSVIIVLFLFPLSWTAIFLFGAVGVLLSLFIHSSV